MNTIIGTTKLQSGRPSLLKLILASAALALLITGCVRPGTPQGWSGVAIENDQLYVGTQDRDIRALNAETGETVWGFSLRGEVESDRAVYGTPAISDGVAYVGGYDGTLYALNLENGNDVWDATIGDGSPIVGGIAVGGGLVFVGSSDGTLYAYDAADGIYQWKYETGNSIWATPAVANDRVFFGSMDQKVYALDLDGQKLWDFHSGGAVTARPLVQDGRVYIGSFSSDFFALDAETGNVIWKFPDAINWYWSRAVTNGDTIFVGSTDGNLYALDAATGRLRWVYPTEGSIVGAPALIGDRVAVGSTDGRVRLVRQQDGQDETQCNIGAAIKAPLTAQGDFLFFRSDDRSIRALEVNPNGNPDEIWVHRSDQDDPVARDWTRSC
ncbi:MAG: PQQ-binding-like beta-propeller repeat protein [Dehalococcoidia bacterium]|nr:PQQ-binding-like beta-propeller repeat protein [Dehalococcoidia bacterium]